MPERFTLPKELVLHAAGAAAACAVLRLRRFEIDELDILLIGIALLSVISGALANNPWEGLRGAAITVSGLSVLLVARRRPSQGREIVTWIAVTAIVLAMTVVFESYGVFKGISSTGRGPGGAMGNRNNAAHLLVLALPSVWLCITYASRTATRWLFPSTAIIGCALTLTRSRAAWLAVIILAAALLPTLALTAARRRTLAFLSSLTVGVVVALLMPNSLQFRSGYGDVAERILEYRVGTGRGRLIQYQNLVRMAADAPLLGVGPRNWQFHYGRYAREADPSYSRSGVLTPATAVPQSDWFGFLAERGTVVFGLLAIVWFILFKSGSQGPLALRPPVTVSLQLFLIVIIVLGALDAVIQLPAGMYLAAVSVAAMVRPNAFRARRFTPPRHLQTLAAVLIIAAGVYASALTVKRIRARQWSGNWYSDMLDPRRLERAAFLDPGSPEIRVLAARAWMLEGRCEQAELHIEALMRMDASIPAGTELRQLCRASGSRGNP